MTQITETWQATFRDAFLSYLHAHNAAAYANAPQSSDNECRTPLECPWTYETDESLWYDQDAKEAAVNYARHLLLNNEIPLDDLVTYQATRSDDEIMLDTVNDKILLDGTWYPITWIWDQAELEIVGPDINAQWRQVGKIVMSGDDVDIDFIWKQDQEAERPEDCVDDWARPERIEVDNKTFYRSDLF